MLRALNSVIIHNFIPTVTKSLKTIQTLSNKIVSVVLGILKVFSDFLFSIPLFRWGRVKRIDPRVLSQTAQPHKAYLISNPSLNSIRTESELTHLTQITPSALKQKLDPLEILIDDVLDPIFESVAQPNLSLVSKRWAAASYQRDEQILNKFKQEQVGCFGTLIQRTLQAPELNNRQRLQQIYTQVMKNAQNWEGYKALFNATKHEGPLSFNRLKTIANWTSDQNLIAFFKYINRYNTHNTFCSNIQSSTFSVTDKARYIRSWMSVHSQRFKFIEDLDLSNLNLTELPDEIALLSNLKTLSLNNNKLSTLPDSIGQLLQLEELQVSNNQLQTLPQSIGQLKKLKWIHLNDNQLKILPESIGQLHELIWLVLDKNKLQQIPESIDQLQKLKLLELNENQLKTLPQKIGQLRELHTLVLTDNQLQTVPESMSQLKNLRIFCLRKNKMQKLPASIEHLAALNPL